MNKNLTEIVMVIDKSGSMQMMREEAQAGINSFIKEHKKDDDVILTLCEFDSHNKFIYDAVPIKDVDRYELIPGTMTALYDALGESISKTGVRLSNIAEEDRPGLVIFVIVTDGMENASHEFRAESIKEMIDHQTDVYNWQFIYLGANQDAFCESRKLSSAATAGNFKMCRTMDAYEGTVSSTRRMKSAVHAGEMVINRYTPEELAAMNDEDGA